MAKQGFGGQWVEICRAGRANDSKGISRSLDRKFLSDVIANYAAGSHDAPIVAGHPESDSAPAYGWATELRLNGDSLEARFTETNDDFEKLVEGGSYKKRSASFYLNPPNLRHVGFLGARPPAIKGLQDIKFAEGESFVLEETINLQENEMGLEDKDVEKVTEGVFEKIKNFFKTPEGTAAGEPAANFTEESAKKLIGDAVDAAKAEFKEQLDAKDQVIADLSAKVDGQITGGKRAEIASFVESLPA
ncbi:MAG TPA: hypothetical protein VGO43_11800, partial [Pyrinomonadaceae bacterium]|nr:hypothetical protein [Pyrinomonadaceae bacterium]